MVRVSQNIGKVPVGGIIRATATDPGSARLIFPSWARTTGNEVVKSEKDGKNFVFYVKRAEVEWTGSRSSWRESWYTLP